MADPVSRFVLQATAAQSADLFQRAIGEYWRMTGEGVTPSLLLTPPLVDAAQLLGSVLKIPANVPTENYTRALLNGIEEELRVAIAWKPGGLILVRLAEGKSCAFFGTRTRQICASFYDGVALGCEGGGNISLHQFPGSVGDIFRL